MATLTYDGTNFTTAFGCLPQTSRSVRHEFNQADGKFVRTVHSVTVEGEIIGVGATTDLLQADITSKIATLLGLSDDGALVFAENDADQAWAYDGSAGSANNLDTRYGVKITQREIPHEDAHHVTRAHYILTFEMVIDPACADDPIAGVASHSYSITQTYDEAGQLVSLVIAGSFCVCDGIDINLTWVNLVKTVHEPEVSALAQAAGYPIGGSTAPTSATMTIIDGLTRRCGNYSVEWSKPELPGGMSSTRLEVSSQCIIEENHVTCTITGVYHFTRPPNLGGGVNLPFQPLGPGGFNPIGPGGGGSNSGQFSDVKREAEGFVGIDPTVFFPEGAGNFFMERPTQMATDLVNKTITATRTYHLNWIHDPDITEYEEAVNIQRSRAGFTAHRRTHTATVMNLDPLPYPQVSGLGATIVTFQIRIVSQTEYKELEPRLPVDRINIFLIEPSSIGVPRTKILSDNNGRGNRRATTAQTAWYESTVVQTFAIIDPAIPEIQAIPIANTQWSDTLTFETAGSNDIGGFA